jgi:hypothetical protein
MAADMPDEVLFTVAGKTATLAKSVRIEDLGLTEPAHLERWVIQHPEALGAGMMIVASQYDKWVTPGGTEANDRLDLLGLDKEGRLVVGELKRGRAPDTVELQAVKYAAMTSRFTLDKLADLHARFLERTSEDKLTNEEAEEKLQAHLSADVEISPELFASPRIVLLAESYPDTTVTSIVWLAEQGVDITLRRYKAYETGGGETIVSVSQIYPLADVGNWLMGPGRGPKKSRKPAEDLPEVAWSVDDFVKLLALKFPVPIEAMNACAESPGTWIASTTVYERAGVEPPSGRGKLAGFGYSVRTTFGRCNPPWEVQWQAGGEHVNYYRLDAETSENWLNALAVASPEGGLGADDSTP